MAEENNPIHVSADSELGVLIRRSMTSGEPIRIETAGRVYNVSIKEDTGVTKQRPTPEQVARARASILAAAGSWKGNVDAEEFKKYIRERRRTANRPSVKL